MASRKTKQKTEPQTIAAPTSSSLPWWIWPAAFVGLLMVYWPALNGPPLFDDQTLPVFMGEHPRAWVHYFRGVRPLYYLSLYLNYLASGRETFSYHLTNLVLHFFSGALVFHILRKLLESTGSDRREACWLALTGSLVFLLHPLQTEAVAYIASRSEALSTPFAYAALALLVGAGRKTVGWGRSASILALLAAGSLAKEPVVAMAAVIFLVDHLMSERKGFSGIAGNWRLHAPLAAAAVLGSIGLATYVSMHSGGTAGLSVAGTSWYEYLWTQFKAIWIYIRLFVFPVGQNLDYRFPHVRTLADPLALLGLAGLICLLYLAWRFRGKYPLASLGVVVFLILLSPTSSFIPIADAVAERRAYFPSIGLLLVLVEFLRRWRGFAWRNALIGVAILALAVGSWGRNHAFGSRVAMWEDCMRANPYNTRGWVQLSYSYAMDGRCAEAVHASEQAEKQGWREQSFYWNFASALECDKQFDRSADVYRKAIALAPNAHAWTLLAGLLARQGLWAEALDALDQAEKLDPALFEVYSFRGGVYLNLGRYDEAAAAYRHALELHPGDQVSLGGLIRVDAEHRSRHAKGQLVSK